MRRFETGWDYDVPYVAYIYDRKLDLKYAVPAQGSLRPFFRASFQHLYGVARLALFRATHKSPWS